MGSFNPWGAAGSGGGAAAAAQGTAGRTGDVSSSDNEGDETFVPLTRINSSRRPTVEGERTSVHVQGEILKAVACADGGK